RMMREWPCELPRSCPPGKRSIPTTRRPRRARWHRAALPTPPVPTTRMSAWMGMSSPLLQLANEDVPELHRIPRVLQSDRPARRHARKLRVLDHVLAVEVDRNPVSLHRDLEPVPLARRLVRLLLRHHGRADRGVELRVGPVAVDFAGTRRPAADVDL